MLKQKDMAKQLGIHVQTLRKWTTQGLSEYKVANNIVMYDVEEVETWIKNKKSNKNTD